MKRIATIFAIIFFGVISFSAGWVIGAWRHWNPALVEVEIENASGKEIAVLRLTHKNGIIEERGIKPGGFRQESFAVAGEGAYELRVEFADGQAVKGGAGYVESGYRIREVVRSHGVESKYRRMSFWP